MPSRIGNQTNLAKLFLSRFLYVPTFFLENHFFALQLVLPDLVWWHGMQNRAINIENARHIRAIGYIFLER